MAQRVFWFDYFDQIKVFKSFKLHFNLSDFLTFPEKLKNLKTKNIKKWTIHFFLNCMTLCTFKKQQLFQLRFLKIIFLMKSKTAKTSKMWNKEKVIEQPVDSQSIDHLIKLPIFVED